MKHSIIELNCEELRRISGGKREVTPKEALYGMLAIAGGLAFTYFFFDPVVNYLERKWKGMGETK